MTRHFARNARQILAGTVAVGVAGFPLLASSAQAASPVAPHHSGPGLSASVTDHIETDQCHVTSTTLSVWRNQVDGELVAYGTWQANFCTGSFHEVSGLAKPAELRFGGTLRAHVVATIPLTDDTTGLPVGSVAVNETWTAVGAPERSHYREIGTDADGHHVIFLYTEVFQTARASGSVEASGGAYIDRTIVSGVLPAS